MNWYSSIRLARKPPSYMMERISDLQFASELARTSPSSARAIIDRTIDHLCVQMDDEYVDDLKEASSIILDSPQKAINIMGIVVDYMQADKRKHDRKKKSWMANWQT
jgi:hypothetical protein